MTLLYARSTDGNNADDGLSWGNAKQTGAGAAAIDAANDTVYFSHVHAESTAGSISWSWAGGLATPTKLVCVNDGAEPPTTPATTGTVTTTGTGSITVAASSSNLYCYGLTFNAGTGSTQSNIALVASGALVRYESCNFKLVNTSASSRLQMDGRVILENCGIQFNAAAQKISTAGGKITVRGGSVLAGGTSPTNLMEITGTADITFIGFDLSNCSAGLNLVTTATFTFPYAVRFVDCKLPASWSGAPHAGTLSSESFVELVNCSDGAVDIAYFKRATCGDVKHETTIVRTGGASINGTPISHKMVTNTQATPNLAALEGVAYVQNDTVGTPITLTVHVITDGVTLTDEDAYIDVAYLSSSGAPLAAHINDRKSSIVATAANQASSSETWTMTGLSSPVKQELSVTVTPQMPGIIIVRPILTKPSTTMYYCPHVEVS